MLYRRAVNHDPAHIDPAHIDLSQRPRTVSFENPTGAASAAGTVAGGRKGAPRKSIDSGERVVLVDIDGPGTVGHIWLTVPPMRPDNLRAITIEVFYDGHDEPSISVPLPDFFGAVHGRPVPYHSALQSTQEGRGYNSWIPMPFRQHLRIELTNHATTCDRPVLPGRPDPRPRGRRARHAACELPAREPHDAPSRLHHRRRLHRPRPVPGVQRRRPHLPRAVVVRLVRRGRGEDVPRRRAATLVVRHRVGGLRRHRVGDGCAPDAVPGRAVDRQRPGEPASDARPGRRSTDGTCPTRWCSNAICG